jgi:hypothetical protein
MSQPGEVAPGPAPPADRPPAVPPVALATVLREWGRIGCIGFGGPPAHIRLLRQLGGPAADVCWWRRVRFIPADAASAVEYEIVKFGT